MAEVLELAQLAEYHRESEVDVARGGIDPELDPQPPAAGQLVAQFLGCDRLGHPAQQCLLLCRCLHCTFSFRAPFAR
ncbi:MAG: hypothetical protein KatS3mg102_1046 [Planctomycetota bacterium]|nr:MAG: hypothetical protein KatS3mg102_1046 [Planctomycetota bacterium]